MLTFPLQFSTLYDFMYTLLAGSSPSTHCTNCMFVHVILVGKLQGKLEGQLA